jgi:hypothetical protein
LSAEKNPAPNLSTLFFTTSLEGIYTAGQAIEHLRFFHANNQLSVHTERALSNMEIIKRYEVGK